ncbi:Crp/Fnr family transcriptional regulator [Kutzneria sp. CA-103260]|uniref:Crp/Fnr family transcriptional regulator n=1 Tax=Kutzneria sp. CA-103260 TaxID=2802641 RepID=UPI001BAE29CA|nr:Crp/Fnr family transcriptional regulator [Kutzneria sp. CA-103260]QUQ69495.1 CRP/FNR family transcriptional regulator [Kutzneria sp. CA-103260]
MRLKWPDGTLMARLNEGTQRDLLMLAEPRECPTGTVLIRQGVPRTDVHLLRSRQVESSVCVKVTATARNGDESLLGIRVSGDVVGELAALRDGNRTATVTVCAPSIVHAIPHRDFIEFLNSHVDAWEALCRMIADRLDWANRRRLDFAGYDVPCRVARVLLELADRHGRPVLDGHELGVRLSQEEIGKLIGAKVDIVGLAMRQLRTQGLVTSSYRRVMINNMDGLRAFADRC